MSKLLNYNYSCGELMLNISTTTSMEHLSTTILQAGRQHHEPAMVRLSWNSEISFHQSSWHYCCTPKIIATWCEKYIRYVCGANLVKDASSVDPHTLLQDNEIWQASCLNAGLSVDHIKIYKTMNSGRNGPLFPRNLAYQYGSFSVFFFQAEDGIRDQPRSRGLGDVYKRQLQHKFSGNLNRGTYKYRRTLGELRYVSNLNGVTYE